MSTLVRTFLRPRWIASSAYFVYGMAGLAFMFLPSIGLRELLGGFGFALWNGMLALGGLVGAYGAWKYAKRIELIGVPGVMVGLVVYALYLFREVPNAQSPGVLVGFGCVCVAACLGLIGRATEIHKLLKIGERVTEELSRRDDDGEES